MLQQGYLVIVDITGYTAFLSESELEHAEDSLLTLLLDRTEPPLVVSRLEGDAVISYAPQGSFLQGQTLVDAMETTYVAFRRALERMVLNTTCTCRACRNIPNLDLKFLVHFGTFMLQDIGEHVELVGSDVNLIHRLTKNGITEKTGFKAYAVYTDAAVQALGIAEMAVGMTPHVETYEHLGAVETHVQDMQVVWERERDRRRLVVEPEDALLTVVHDFPLGPSMLWDYVTKPEYRSILSGSSSARVEGGSDGRIGAGSAYYCAHGMYVSVQTVVDWQPFEQITYESTFMKATGRWTVRLDPIYGGTRMTVLIGKSTGNLVARIVGDIGSRIFEPSSTRKGAAALHERIQQEIRDGTVARPITSDIPTGSVAQAVSASLASQRGAGPGEGGRTVEGGKLS